MTHAENVNEFSDRRQEFDAAIRGLDRLIAELKPMASSAGRKAATPAAPAEDPTAILARLADMRDRGLISADDYEAKKHTGPGPRSRRAARSGRCSRRAVA
jgi:Short C-terminal domain